MRTGWGIGALILGFLIGLAPANAAGIWRNKAVTQYVAVTCPSPISTLVVVGFGQSNAANHLGTPVATPNKKIKAYMSYLGKCYQIEDPVLGATTEPAPVNGSVWTRAARMLATDLDRPVLIIASGWGGTDVGQWADNWNNVWGYTQSEVSRVQAKGYKVKHWVWLQGEKDARIGTSANDYTSRLNTVIDRAMALSPTATFWNSLQTVCTGVPANEPVRSGQQAIADIRSDTELLGDFDTLFTANFRNQDGCHFNGNGAYSVARLIADKIIAAER